MVQPRYNSCKSQWRLVVKMTGRAAKFHPWLNIWDCRPGCLVAFPVTPAVLILSNLHFQLSLLIHRKHSLKLNETKPKPVSVNITQKKEAGLIKSMMHNHFHQSCKVESQTQHHSHTKLRPFCSTTKALLLTRQSLAFYSNCVMVADLG